MALRKVEIHVPGREPGWRGEILVDGERLTGVTGWTASWPSVKDIPRLEVSLITHEVDYFGEASVVVPEKTRDSLIKLGWTPPPDEA